jgi:anti-sigma factor RsiW
MNRPDHSTYREWLNLEVDGLLPNEQRPRFEEHLASCSECQEEREELLLLGALLERSSLAVRPDFKDGVMESLPYAGWEARAPRTWGVPAAVFVLFGGIAAALMVTGPISGNASSGFSALLAVAEMFRAATLAGAGLLNASWKGVGLLFNEVFPSSFSLGVFAFFVICLNLLLVSLVRRRQPARARGELGRK